MNEYELLASLSCKKVHCISTYGYFKLVNTIKRRIIRINQKRRIHFGFQAVFDTRLEKSKFIYIYFEYENVIT